MIKNYSMLLLAVFVCIALLSCSSKYDKVEQSLKDPVNCYTAEGDLRILESEKVHTAEQIAAGVTSIVPVGMVVGLLTGTEESKVEVATGEYNDMLDKKIAHIKYTCGLE